MFATIWMCTHEWSLISMRTTAFTFVTCHHAFSCRSAFTRSISRRSFRLPRTGQVDVHLLDRLGGRQARLADGLLGDGLLDPLLGLGIEVHAGSTSSSATAGAVSPRGGST